MRNPIRLKNLKWRFVPVYLLGLGALVLAPPQPSGFVWGLPLVLAGVGLRSWGAGHLVKNDALTMTGPYSYLRHPLYAGTLLLGTGFAMLFGGMISLLLVAVLWPWFALDYFPRKDRVECARLAARYGPDFEAYAAAVPALWPRRTAFEPPAWARRHWALDRYSDNNELGTVLAVVLGLLIFWIRASADSA